MTVICGTSNNTSGLIFEYDMYNSKKSWMGKPTTNFVSNPNNISNWAYSGITISLDTLKLPYEVELKSPFGQMADQIVGFGWIAHTATASTTGLQYTSSIYVKVYGSETSVFWTWGEAHTGSRSTFLVNLLTGEVSNLNIIAGESYSITKVDNGWWRIACSTTLTGDANFPQLSCTVGLYLCGMQIEQNSFATPFVNGTRSNTQAILDLTNKNIITASNLTYDSNGEFSFNGTANQINIDSNIDLSTNFTIEIWFKTSSNSELVLFERLPFLYFCISAGFLDIRYSSHIRDNTKRIDDNFWHQGIVCINYNLSNITFYIDGIIGLSTSYILGSWGNTYSIIGSRGYGLFFNGKIARVSVYNRCLTSEEVKNNFNALRYRFGI